MSAAGVAGSTAPTPGASPGSTPRAALHRVHVAPVPTQIARKFIERHHYLRSLPGGTHLCFGVLLVARLLGAVTLGAGPALAYSLVEGASPKDCMTLSRVVLSDFLPKNSESRVLGVVLRALRKSTDLKFLVTYADPAQGHVGVIYQATGWLYTGLSEAMPLYDLGDGNPRHSRSFSHAFGTHSVAYFASNGVPVTLVPQQAKHRYLYFLDPTWRERLRVPALPYPKKELWTWSSLNSPSTS